VNVSDGAFNPTAEQNGLTSGEKKTHTKGWAKEINL